MHLYILGLTFDTSTLAVVAVVGVTLLGVAWFAIKFWLASTRPPDIKEIQTPALDRMNQRALAALADEEEEEDEDAPEDLQKVVEEPRGGSAE